MGMASSISKVAAVISPFVGAQMLDLPLFMALSVFAGFFCVGGMSRFGFLLFAERRLCSCTTNLRLLNRVFVSVPVLVIVMTVSNRTMTGE